MKNYIKNFNLLKISSFIFFILVADVFSADYELITSGGNNTFTFKAKTASTVSTEINNTSQVFDGTFFVKYGDSGSTANKYYVDATNGNDNNDGLSQGSAWKSLTKVNNAVYAPGDYILFKSGDRWNGVLNILKSNGTENNPIVYGAYGSEKPPVITIFVEKKLSWTNESSNIWKSTNLNVGTLRLALDGKEVLYAAKKSELGTQIPDLVKWHQDENNVLYLYSDTSPINQIVGLNPSQNALTVINNNITIRDIEFEGGTQGSIKIFNSTNIVLDNVKAGKYSKSGLQIMGSQGVKVQNSIFDADFTFDYSNANEYKEASARGTTDGIIFSRSNSACIVQNNYIKNWGHGSILIQPEVGETNGYEIKDLKINNNYMTSPDITYGGRFAIYGNAHDIEVFNNDFIDLSTQNQIGGYHNHIHHNIINGVRTSPIKEDSDIGVGIAASGFGNIYENNIIANTESECFKLMGAETYDNIFRNNILYNCGIKMNGVSIGLRLNDGGWMLPDIPSSKNNAFYNNIIHSGDTTKLIKHYTDGEMTLIEFKNNYTSFIPSQNNFNSNPNFISDSDFHLQVNSPALATGIQPLSILDKDGNRITDSFNIGAYNTP